jgi:hypothetical protein
MKQIVLAVVAVAAGFAVAATPLHAEPSWQPLPHVRANAQLRQLPTVPVRGHRYWGWRRQPFGPLLMLPPALTGLVLRSFAPVPPQSYRDSVRPEPVPPDAEEPAPPAIASPPAAPDLATEGSSTRWVDPDEPAR